MLKREAQRQTKIGLLLAEPFQPVRYIAAPPIVTERVLPQRGVPVPMAMGQNERVLRALQVLVGVLADGLEKPVPHGSTGACARQDERLVDEPCEQVQDVAARKLLATTDGLRGVERPATREDGQAVEQPLLSRAQQVVAPVNRRAQSLVPPWSRAPA